MKTLAKIWPFWFAYVAGLNTVLAFGDIARNQTLCGIGELLISGVLVFVYFKTIDYWRDK